MKIMITSDLHYGYDYNSGKVFDKFWIQVLDEDPDIILIAGDIISHDQTQYEKFFSRLRDVIGYKIQILIVKGNHDYWQAKYVWAENKRTYEKYNIVYKTLDDILKYHNEIHDRYNIWYLQDKLYYYSTYDLRIQGFDGWYATENNETNDYRYMPFRQTELEIYHTMNTRAHYSLDKILENMENDRCVYEILVTHMPSYTFEPTYKNFCASFSYMDIITKTFDYYIVGHSHQRERWKKNGCEIINAGSDYNMPRYDILTI
jgi:predicted phosphodiesterase